MVADRVFRHPNLITSTSPLVLVDSFPLSPLALAPSLAEAVEQLFSERQWLRLIDSPGEDPLQITRTSSTSFDPMGVTDKIRYR